MKREPIYIKPTDPPETFKVSLELNLMDVKALFNLLNEHSHDGEMVTYTNIREMLYVIIQERLRSNTINDTLDNKNLPI
jgi:hypothetical protein